MTAEKNQGMGPSYERFGEKWFADRDEVKRAIGKLANDIKGNTTNVDTLHEAVLRFERRMEELENKSALIPYLKYASAIDEMTDRIEALERELARHRGEL